MTMDAAGVFQIPPPDWLIAGILPKSGVAVLFGPEKTGKSFIALDMAFHVATGRPWFGRKTKPGPVFYIASEGLSGLGSRVRVLYHEKANKGEEFGTDLFFIPQPIPFHTPDGLRQLEIAIHDTYSTPALIILDTFHACCPGIDENSAQDIGQFVSTANIVRRQTGATTMIIHHSRKGSREYRGHTSIAGAADTMLGVEMDKAGVISMTCRKQKEAEAFPPEFFDLKVVTIPADPVKVKLGKAKDTVSCVIERTTLAKKAVAKTLRLRKTSAEALKVLVDHGPQTWTNWRQLSKITDSTLNRCRMQLQEGKFINHDPATQEYSVDPSKITKEVKMELEKGVS
jgi:hypothetical protein